MEIGGAFGGEERGLVNWEYPCLYKPPILEEFFCGPPTLLPLVTNGYYSTRQF
jgi:hypothetical protein